MKESHIKLIIKILMFVGLILIVIGFALMVFTNLEKATSGVLLIVGLITVGMFIVLPTKIYLTLQALKKIDENREMKI